MKNKKILTTFLLGAMVLCCVTSFTACSNKGDGNGSVYSESTASMESEASSSESTVGTLIFELNEAQTEYTVQDASNSDTEIVIPSTYKGLPVTSIGQDAFYNCSKLTSVTIPDSVTSIGRHAFYKCSSLTHITIPNSVISIEEEAFRDCSSLTSVTMSDGITSMGSSVFKGCGNMQYNEHDNAYYLGNETNPYVVLMNAKATDITSCVIHSETKIIAAGAFRNCSSLIEITIPDSVISIENGAFNGCASLTSAIIGKGVTSIGTMAFYGCASLTSVTIPDGVTAMEGATFANCSKLTSITIGSGVTTIANQEFENCSSLTSITIPESVTSIVGSAFNGCVKLKSVKFNGTIEQWNSLYKSNGWNEDIPATEVVCSDGKVTL